jgi:hypothetical protein
MAIIIFLSGCVGDFSSSEMSEEGTPIGVKTTSSIDQQYADYEIVNLLPRDAIQAIDDPIFLSVDEVNKSYTDEEQVIGVEYNGDARAYSVQMLSSHEIVNDTVGGVKIAVTW